MWKEAVMAQFEVLAWHLSGRTEENHKIVISLKSLPDFLSPSKQIPGQYPKSGHYMPEKYLKLRHYPCQHIFHYPPHHSILFIQGFKHYC